MGSERSSEEPLHRALSWVEDRRRTDRGRSVEGLVAEAAHRFGLPPVARELLARTLGAHDEKRRR